MRARKLVAMTAVLAMLLTALPAQTFAAKPAAAAGARHVNRADVEGQRVSPGNDKVIGQPPIGPAKVGTNRTWVGLDDVRNTYYLKNYTLRATGDHVEVWVADDLRFPNVTMPNPLTADPADTFTYNDCRNSDPDRITVTNDQAAYLADQFDEVMYPAESEAFSVPPSRDGHKAVLPTLFPNLPSSAYKGEGDNIVVLVDNVRDTNFYDRDTQSNFTYIAGFFSAQVNDFFNRNVMTIDSYDWIHRTGADPEHEPTDNLCTSAPARPFLYEGVFAHEYQHLLMHYEDADEVSWINEGLSDWAQTLTGYVDPSKPIDDIDFDSHIQCILGWLSVKTDANPIPRPESGPENSLTVWSDQGDDEILCDYGAAYSFMELLANRFGTDFMSALHRNDANGLAGLQEVLDEFGGGDAADLIHEWAAMLALDSVLDDGATLNGGDAADYQVATLDASINWDTVHAYDTPGAPPNGSDYVRLRDGGAFLSAAQIDEISFNGASVLESWIVDPDGHGAGDAALYSQTGDLVDQQITREVTVPNASPTLTFDARWDTEELWDFGYVQVSTDDGATWTSLPTEDTTSDHDPDAHPDVVANLPGFTGDSDGWQAETVDMSAYAGDTVMISFRYITDWFTFFPGFWVDNVALGGTLISDGSDIDDWTAIDPTPVNGFTVQLIAYADDGSAAWIGQLPLDENFDGSLSGAELDAVIGTTAETVAAIVTYDEPTESSPFYARYSLSVDGVTQPGG